MSILKGFERVQTEDGSLRFLCHLETDVGVIKKSVVVSAGFIATSNRGQIRDYILHMIGVRSKESDRHAEFAQEKYGNGKPHRNPKQQWQQKEDVKLHDTVTRGEIERQINEALNA